MEETKQYLKYRDDLKKQCIFMIVSNVLALLTLVFLIFIPCFQIVLKDDVTGIVFGRLSFSLFDEIKLVFENFGNDSSDPLLNILPIYQIFGIVILIVCIGLIVFWCVKNILNLVSLNDFALISYDAIKTKADRSIGSFFKKFGVLQLFLSGFICEILYIVLAKFFNSILHGGENESATASYVVLMNGVSGSIAVVIVFAVAAVAFMVYVGYLKRKLKVAILKENWIDPFKSPETENK